MRIERLEELHGLLWKMADGRTKYARLTASGQNEPVSEQISFPGNMENSARVQTLIDIYLDEALEDSISMGEAALELQVLENRREGGQNVETEIQAATRKYIDAHGKITWKLNQRLNAEVKDTLVAKEIRGLLARSKQ